MVLKPWLAFKTLRQRASIQAVHEFGEKRMILTEIDMECHQNAGKRWQWNATALVDCLEAYSLMPGNGVRIL